MEVSASHIHARYPTHATQDPPHVHIRYVYGTFTLSGAPFQDDFHFLHLDYRRSSPHISPRFPMEIRFVLFRFHSPLLTESRLISFPLPTEMLQFRRFPFLNEEWHRVPGGPIQQFADPRDSCLSPQLIAACHDLLRLSSRAIPQSGCSILILQSHLCESSGVQKRRFWFL